ncbi:MAG: general secretion pathway protein GspB [Xanthomonadaceae bacterium]|nr:general secretion pathway protein GspB [Xanthomonadaceae bacterium]
MSFILEALKKSENARQRVVGPSLADVQVAARREEKPWWAFAVGGLLLLNLAVLLFVLLRDGETTSASVAVTTSEPPAHAPAQPAPAPAQQATPIARAPERQPRPTQPTVSNPAVRSLADEAAVEGFPADASYPLDRPNLAAAAKVPEGPPIVRPIETAPALTRPGTPAAPEESNEVLPTLQALRASGTHLPDMHLDIHVHSPVPAERFVFVNMRKYVEGQALAEGPTIERIRSDGVVLNHQGMRFLLPRQ